MVPDERLHSWYLESGLCVKEHACAYGLHVEFVDCEVYDILVDRIYVPYVLCKSIFS